jgi:hypothetical protein
MSRKPGDFDRFDHPAIDRRAFLGNVGVVAGAVMAASVMPLVSAGAASFEAPARAAPVRAPVVADSSDELRHVDDMWGHWPRYAHPVPYARMQAAPALWERADPVDRMLVG